MDRKQIRAARRADATGTGPTLEERPPARFPGATGGFALFGEVLQVGLLVTLVALPIVTLPVALAAGIRHLRRYLHAEGSSMAQFWRDVREALPSGIALGAVTVLISAVLAADIVLAGSGALPGGDVIAAIGWIGMVAVWSIVLLAAAAWRPHLGWMNALRSTPATIRGDLVGAIYVAVAVVFVGLVTWMLPPLIVAGFGCAALAVLAVPTRRRHR